MVDKITIEFGAQIDQLVDGVNKINDKLSSLHSGVEKAGEGLKKFAEIAGIAFSVEGIKHFIESMAELGLQTERVMATLGLSAQETVQLGGMAQLTGTSLEGMALSIERMSLNIQRASKDGLNPAAQALKVLGLTANDFKNLSTDQYIEKLHDAVSKFAPSLALTNAVMQVGGRGVAQIIPLLQQSGHAWDEMKLQIEAARRGIADFIPGMAETHAGISLMTMSMQSLGVQIFGALKPGIDAVVKTLTTYVQIIRDSIKDQGAWYQIMSSIAFVVKMGALAFAGLAAAIEITYLQFRAFWEYASKGVTLDITKDVEAAAKRMRDTVASVFGSGAHVEVTGKAKAGNIDQSANERFQATIAEIEGQNKLWQGWLTQQKAIFQASADMWQITELGKLQLTRDAANQSFEAERANLLKIAELYRSQNKLKEVQDTNNKIKELEQTHATDMIKINADMMRDIKQRWDDVFGAFQNSFNGQLRGLLAGTTSFRQAFKSIIGDMVIFFAQQVEKMVFNWIAGKLAMSAVDQAEVAKSVATQVAAREATLPGRAAAFASDITAAAAIAFANTYAALAAAPPVAAAAAAGSEAVVLAQLGGIPKYELGTDYVPRTGLAIVHEGEKITPASQNTGGGAEMHLHISAVDAQSFVRLINSNSGAFANMIKRAMRDNLLQAAG